MNIFTKLGNLFKPKEGKQEKQEIQGTIKTGSINFFNRSRGYGFIKSKENSTKIFFHITEIEGRFRIGDQVKFKLDRNAKGLVARNVELTK